jgi:hypothetical protein
VRNPELLWTSQIKNSRCNVGICFCFEKGHINDVSFGWALGSMHDVSPSFSRNGNYQATAARGALLNVFTRERILQACLLSHGEFILGKLNNAQSASI